MRRRKTGWVEKRGLQQSRKETFQNSVKRLQRLKEKYLGTHNSWWYTLNCEALEAAAEETK